VTILKSKPSLGLLLAWLLTLTSVHTASPQRDAAPCARPIAAEGTYHEIGVPGAKQTEARGINNRGHIVGYYADARRISSTGFCIRKAM
jgi:hypothetical protein